MTKKLQAYTILETLISMIIMLVIGGITFFIYNSFSYQVSKYQKDQHLLSEYIVLKNALKVSLYRSEDFYKQHNQVVFYNKKKEKEVYTFFQNKVVRKYKDNIHEFHLDVISVKELTAINIEKEFCPRLQIIISLSKELFSVTLQKQCGTAPLINNISKNVYQPF